MTSLVSFGIEVASVNYRETAIFGNDEAGHGDVSGESGAEGLAEFRTVSVEGETKRATKDDALGFDGGRKRNESEQYALDDFVPVGGVGDFGDEFVVFFVDGAGGGEVFPFFGFALIDVFDVAGLEVGVALDDLAIFDHAATDTGRKGEVKGAPLETVGLGEGGKIGVVIEVNGEIEVVLEHGGKVEIVPVEIAKPDGLIVLNDARHGDSDGLEARDAEINPDLLEHDAVEFLLVLDGGEFD